MNYALISPQNKREFLLAPRDKCPGVKFDDRLTELLGDVPYIQRFDGIFSFSIKYVQLFFKSRRKNHLDSRYK